MKINQNISSKTFLLYIAIICLFSSLIINEVKTSRVLNETNDKEKLNENEKTNESENDREAIIVTEMTIEEQNQFLNDLPNENEGRSSIFVLNCFVSFFISISLLW